MNTTERMKTYLEYKGIPTSRAEKTCSFGNATLVSAFKNPNASLGSEKLEVFLNTYQDLSAEWLLRGVGDMIIGDGKAKELQTKIAKMSMGKRNQDEAYDVILSMVDMVTKTYEFFGKKEE